MAQRYGEKLPKNKGVSKVGGISTQEEEEWVKKQDVQELEGPSHICSVRESQQ